MKRGGRYHEITDHFLNTIVQVMSDDHFSVFQLIVLVFPATTLLFWISFTALVLLFSAVFDPGSVTNAAAQNQTVARHN